jgi:transcriptional regulator with XRE-family HTH domain
MSDTFGERLHKSRKTKGLSQADLAARLGFTAHTIISRWEKNSAHPSFKHLLKLNEILEVDLHWLITGENFNPQKRIESRFKELYTNLLNEFNDAQETVRQLESKRQSGQPLTPEEEGQLLQNKGILKARVRQMENIGNLAKEQMEQL